MYLYFNEFLVSLSYWFINPLNTDKLRLNATFGQQMAFFGHFRPNVVPILEKSAF